MGAKDGWEKMCTICGGNLESHTFDQNKLQGCPWKEDMQSHPNTPGKGKPQPTGSGGHTLNDCPWKGLRGHPYIHDFHPHTES